MKRKRKITKEGILRFLNDFGEQYLSLERKAVWRRLYAPKYFGMEDYFPSAVERSITTLERKGLVEKVTTEKGVVVKLTEKGKQEKLFFDLDKLLTKVEKWDGKWRMVMFDIEEIKSKKRREIRKYLQKLGFKLVQKSVWICPFNREAEIKYVREVLDIPHEVKMGILEKMENDEDLRKWWNL